jgi:hypothetical protein
MFITVLLWQSADSALQSSFSHNFLIVLVVPDIPVVPVISVVLTFSVVPVVTEGIGILLVV